MLRRLLLLLVSACACFATSDLFADGKLLLKATENEKPVPFRLHLRTERQVPQKVPPLPFWSDHVAVPGSVQLRLPNGNYFFEIERGSEYHDVRGYFTIGNGADDEKTVPLTRACDLTADGWRSGDLEVRRSPRDIEQAMLADDLRYVPLVTWSNRKSEWSKARPFPKESIVSFDDKGRYYDLAGGLDDRPGGPIHLFRLPEPATLPPLTGTSGASQLISMIPQLDELKTKHPNLWIDVAHPGAWDLPILVASGLVDSVCLAPSSLQRTKVDLTPVGRPLDRALYPGRDSACEFAHDVYFHLLNCGLRIAPSAGSGSGVSPNPVGYNRVYVWDGLEESTPETWWESFKQGRAFVTNGPLPRPRADGRLPGHVFTGTPGEPVTLNVSMDLTTRDKISYIELIHNGKVASSLPLQKWAENGGRFQPVTFHESGWCLLRIRCDSEKTYKFAMTAPWYVVIADTRSVSRSSVQFFVDWVEARAAMLKVTDAAEKKIVDEQLDLARSFWRRKLDAATAP